MVMLSSGSTRPNPFDQCTAVVALRTDPWHSGPGLDHPGSPTTIYMVETSTTLRGDMDKEQPLLPRPPHRPARCIPVQAQRCMLALAALFCVSACRPSLVVGERKCPELRSEAGSPPKSTDPVSVPWSTGFEDQFCDYTRAAGSCYDPPTFQVVTSPVHTGQLAAAFTVSSRDGAMYQSRCVRDGVFPTQAYYGAWYYIPEYATNTGTWNLFFFQGGKLDKSSAHGLWDVSLVNRNGALVLQVRDFLRKNTTDGAAIPIARWFHLVFYLKRAKDNTGEAALYLDGSRVVSFANLVTDDTEWGQWYAGNYVTALNPPDSTVYMDDVTISEDL